MAMMLFVNKVMDCKLFRHNFSAKMTCKNCKAQKVVQRSHHVIEIWTKLGSLLNKVAVNA